MAKPIAESEVEAARAELERVRVDWLRRPGVTAVDVGLRHKGGQLTGELAIRVHVQRKRPPEELAKGELFPESLGRFDVDVLEASYAPQSEVRGPERLD